MKKLTFLLALFCVCLSYSQQEFTISGTILAEDDKTSLESATVYLERIKDSTLVTYTISDKDGKFELFEETYDKSLYLKISSVGFQNYRKEITIDKANINLGTILLPTANTLDEVVIKSTAPVTIKKDTLEFNVKSFKTKKDANVEDLLKQLPGVEVDDQGQITVNGKPVNKILVNGKPFFGDDPTITTKNLTKEIIEKVQITDTKTKSEAFSGEEGDKENKTINLTIKEENNKGVFGRLAAGGGTDERYEYAGLVNVFDNDQRISVLAGGNNINSPGFSFGEIRKMFGGGYRMSMSSNGSFSIDGRSFGGGQGITASNNLGANYADELSDKIDVSADYFATFSDSENETKTERENILPDSRYFTSSNSKSVNDSENHSANLDFDVEVDSTFLINLSPSFRATKSKNNYQSEEQSFDEDNILTNSSSLSSYVETIGRNFSNDFDVTKRFGANGAFLKLSMDLEFNETTSDDFINSETLFEDTGADDVIRDQFTDGERSENTFSSNFTYRLPLISKTLFLDFKYGYRSDRREDRKSTFDFDAGSQAYDVFNEALSTDFEYINTRQTPSLQLSYRKEKWSANIEGGYVFRTLENQDALRPELSLKQDFKALELDANFNYRFSPKASMYSGYYLNNQPPQINQLQAFQNVSNPLNTITGNPNLEPSNSHNLYFGFNSFDFQKKTGFFSYANINVTNNQIVSKTTIDDDLVRNTTYTNVDGNYRMNLSTSYRKTIKLDSLKTLRYKLGVHGNFSRNVNFNNDVQYASRNRSITPNVGLRYRWADVMELEPNYSLSLSKNTFDIDDFEDQEFLRHNLGIKTATFLPKNLEWRNDISYSYNPNVARGFQKSAWFWNATMAYSFMKDKMMATLKVYDLLNQNTNARRTATQDYIQDSQSTVLTQYFMLSLSWKFNSLGKKGETGGNDVFFFD